MVGLANVPLAAAYQGNLPADTCGNGMAVRQLFEYTSMTILAVALAGLAHLGLPPLGQFWVVALLATVGAVVCWRLLFAQFLEQAFELLMMPMYRIRAQGPGLDKIPRHGPLLVVANHSAWFDPLWLGKILPRQIRPMMTSLFYDLPGLRWLMKNAVQAIRVQFSRYCLGGAGTKRSDRGVGSGPMCRHFPGGFAAPWRGATAAAVRPGRLAHPARTAADAGGGVLDRGRLGQFLLVFQWVADEEQTAGLVPRIEVVVGRRRWCPERFWTISV